jgi:hypothetical protein
MNIPIIHNPVSQGVSIHAEQLRSPHYRMRHAPFVNQHSTTSPHFQEAGQASGKVWRSRHHPPLHHLGRVFVEAQPLRYARQLLLDSDRADQSDALKSNHSHSQYFGSLIRSRAPGCSKSPYRPPEYRGQSSANPASMTKAPMSLPLR